MSPLAIISWPYFFTTSFGKKKIDMKLNGIKSVQNCTILIKFSPRVVIPQV